MGLPILGSPLQFRHSIMGVTDSKLALVKLSAACSTAEENGRNDIKHVLSDKQVSYVPRKQRIPGLIIRSSLHVLQVSGNTFLNLRKNRFRNGPGKPQRPARTKRLHFLRKLSQTLTCGERVPVLSWMQPLKENLPHRCPVR